MNVAIILKDKGRDVLTVREDISLKEVTRILAAKGIGCIVVIKPDESLAGIISERDVVRTLGEGGWGRLDEPVSRFMTANVITCGETDTIDHLMSVMTSKRFRHMPVVEDGRLVGIISIGDVVKQRIAEAEMEAAAMRDYISAT